jgi:membrane protease subunit (stomatin/prohibitin family)
MLGVYAFLLTLECIALWEKQYFFTIFVRAYSSFLIKIRSYMLLVQPISYFQLLLLA